MHNPSRAQSRFHPGAPAAPVPASPAAPVPGMPAPAQPGPAVPASPGAPAPDDSDAPDARLATPWFAKAAERLFKARTVLIHGEITSELAQTVTAQLLALAAENDQPVTVFLHSEGGHVEAGDSIHDLVRFITPPVRMVGTGWVASAGTHIYLAAARERRFCLPNTRFLIHQPLGGVGGRASDIRIEAEEILKMRERLNRTIADATGQPLKRVAADTDRNHWMSPQEARDYGIVGRIINSARELAATADSAQ